MFLLYFSICLPYFCLSSAYCIVSILSGKIRTFTLCTFTHWEIIAEFRLAKFSKNPSLPSKKEFRKEIFVKSFGSFWTRKLGTKKYKKGTVEKRTLTRWLNWRFGFISFYPFHTTGLLLYPLKTSENQGFSDVSRCYRKSQEIDSKLTSQIVPLFYSTDWADLLLGIKPYPNLDFYTFTKGHWILEHLRH